MFSTWCYWYIYLCYFVFFFKQKTAYEMRISDWSSDVCSSDLGRAFGVMPGALDGGPFGAKLVSVFPDNFEKGGRSHQGVVALFDPETGAPVAILDAGEITAIRTAAASAAATDVIARRDATRLAILGYGEQAWRHVQAIRHVRSDRQSTRLN